jgi:hypothetical protein
MSKLLTLFLALLLAAESYSEVVRVNLREVPLKTALHTLYAATLGEPVSLSPALVASDKKVTIDVRVDSKNLRDFADAFIDAQGVIFKKKGGALHFDFGNVKPIEEEKKLDNQTEKDVSKSLQEMLNYSPDCWVSMWSPPDYAIQCLDGDYLRADELRSLKPKVDLSLRTVRISGVTYRNRTPALFFAQEKAKQGNRDNINKVLQEQKQ